MKKMIRLWINTRSKIAMAMIGCCAVWALSALNMDTQDPDMVQIAGAVLLGLYCAGKEIQWS